MGGTIPWLGSWTVQGEEVALDSQSIGGVTEGESRAGLGAHRVAREEKAQRVASTGWKWLSEDSAGEGSRGGHSAVMHSRHSTEMVRHGPLWVSTGEGHTHQQHHCKPKSGHQTA